MKKSLRRVHTGDFVYCTGDSGFCHSSYEVVIDTTVKYDQNNGKPYNVIHLTGGRLFDSRDGSAMTSPSAYYIIPADQNKAFKEVQASQEESLKIKADIKAREEKRKQIIERLTKEERDILGL